MNVSTTEGKIKSNLGNRVLASIRHNMQFYTLIIAVIVIWVIFYFLTGSQYLDPQNISNLFRQMTVTSFMSIGMVLVIVTGGIDLSVGKLAGFVSVVVAYLQYFTFYAMFPDQPLLAAILSVIVGLLVGAAAGALQGYFIAFQGLPARICWLGQGEREKAGLAFNELVRTGKVKAPIVIGRDHLDTGSVASPNRETEAMLDGSDAVADWPILNALVNTAGGASWVSLHHGGGVGMGYSIHAGMVIVADGTADDRQRRRVGAADQPVWQSQRLWHQFRYGQIHHPSRLRAGPERSGQASQDESGLGNGGGWPHG